MGAPENHPGAFFAASAERPGMTPRMGDASSEQRRGFLEESRVKEMRVES
jgi:hypothetical protein